MQADRFTIKAQEAIAAAGQLAERRHNPQVTPEHLLSVLLEQEGGVVAPVLSKLGADVRALRAQVNADLDALPTMTAGGEAAGPSSELVRVLREAEEEMRELKDEYVSTEHLLLALADHSSRAGEALRNAGARRDALEKAIADVRAAEGAVDAANLLKPMLARGELRAVGATTLDEYRKHIEKDAALERRFQPIFVGEPSVADTIAILRGLKERYESHHGVEIRDAALVAAAVLSDRYISDRQLPDKAIDLVDEAASRLEIESSPVELDEANRRVTQLEIELAAMAGESGDVRAPVEAQLADAREARDALAARWAQEKAALERVAEIKRRIDELKMEAERSERQGELQRVAEIRYGELPALENELEERQAPE